MTPSRRRREVIQELPPNAPKRANVANYFGPSLPQDSVKNGHLPPSQGDLHSMLSPRTMGDEFVSTELSDDITPPTEHSSSSHSMLPPQNLGEEFVSIELSSNITTTVKHSSFPHSMLPP